MVAFEGWDCRVGVAEVYAAGPVPGEVAAADYRTLRPKRQQPGLLQVHAAAGLGVSTAKISLAERGQVHDAVFLTAFESWLNSRDLTQ